MIDPLPATSPHQPTIDTPSGARPIYRVAREPNADAAAGLDQPPPLDAWARVSHFHAASSDHRPDVRAALRYTDAALLLWFHAEDRYVRATRTGWQQSVCRDSCVEFFFQPDPALGYLNLEINCGGAMLLEYGRRLGRGERTFLPDAAMEQIRVQTTLPATVEPEIAEPVTWQVACTVPFAALAMGYPEPARFPPRPGTQWRANFYKCADESSRPHWAAWSSVGERKAFHQPERFGVLVFE